MEPAQGQPFGAAQPRLITTLLSLSSRIPTSFSKATTPLLTFSFSRPRTLPDTQGLVFAKHLGRNQHADTRNGAGNNARAWVPDIRLPISVRACRARSPHPQGLQIDSRRPGAHSDMPPPAPCGTMLRCRACRVFRVTPRDPLLQGGTDRGVYSPDCSLSLKYSPTMF